MQHFDIFNTFDLKYQRTSLKSRFQIALREAHNGPFKDEEEFSLLGTGV
jgi:hypothetical protein